MDVAIGIDKSLSMSRLIYVELLVKIVQSIGRRRLDWTSVSDDPSGYRRGAKSSPPSSPPSVKPTKSSTEEWQPKQETTDGPRGGSSDPIRRQVLDGISSLREEFRVSGTHSSSE